MSCVSPGIRYFSAMSATCLLTSVRRRCRRRFSLVVGLGVAIGGHAFERKFRVDHQRALVGQEHAAVGTRLVGQRVLEGIGAFRQAVLDDRLHPPLAEGAARLLVGEHALQRRHLGGKVGDVLLRAVDDRKPLAELLQILSGAQLGLLQRIAKPVRDRIEALVDGVGELRLALGEHADHGLKPRRRVGLRAREFRHHRVLGRRGIAGAPKHDRHGGNRAAGDQDGHNGDDRGGFGHALLLRDSPRSAPKLALLSR